jgi:prepilin-type N-terminal cleavage/methylation domain-containing protein
MKTSVRHRWAKNVQRGFTLIENMLALGIVASAALPILGLIAIGLTDAKQAGDHRLTANLRNTVHQLLADPSWPEEARPTGEWTAERHFDHAGKLITADEKSQAGMKLHLRKIPAPGFQSEWLETIEATFHTPDRPEVIARTLIQRRKLPAQG